MKDVDFFTKRWLVLGMAWTPGIVSYYGRCNRHVSFDFAMDLADVLFIRMTSRQHSSWQISYWRPRRSKMMIRFSGSTPITSLFLTSTFLSIWRFHCILPKIIGIFQNERRNEIHILGRSFSVAPHQVLHCVSPSRRRWRGGAYDDLQTTFAI